MPSWRRIVQRFPHRALPSVSAAVAEQFARPDIHEAIQPGMRVAIGVGSRGIGCLPEAVAAVVAGVRSLGAEPFIVPAMGSHGGGTAEGQEELLASYGISEANVDAPVRACMETVPLGTVGDGLEIVFDRIAFKEADAVVPVARVKPHTDFRGDIESGLHKMLAIGLGKQAGARNLHTYPLDQFGELIPAAGQLVLAQVNVPFGIAIIEDAYEQAALIEAVPGAEMAAREPELLRLAREWQPKLPISEMDVLVIGEFGKDIAGPGMDPNVTGRYTLPTMPRHVHIDRVILLRLTERTHGTATGLGMADIVTEQLAEEIDFFNTYMNHVSANSVEGAKVPLIAASDQEAIAIALMTLGRTQPLDARIGWIKNTLRLDKLALSENLVHAALQSPEVELGGDLEQIRFDATGALISPWRDVPESNEAELAYLLPPRP
jgi:hypothetical protein